MAINMLAAAGFTKTWKIIDVTEAEPGSVAAALVYENLWAAPFASALRRAGARLIADGRIPTQDIIAAIEADEALEAEGA